MRIPAAVIAFVVIILISACRAPVSPSDSNIVRVNGTVRFMTFEGGFWAVRGDDNVTYDPLNGLPAAFQVEGLRVRLEAKRRRMPTTFTWPARSSRSLRSPGSDPDQSSKVLKFDGSE